MYTNTELGGEGEWRVIQLDHQIEGKENDPGANMSI